MPLKGVNTKSLRTQDITEMEHTPLLITLSMFKSNCRKDLGNCCPGCFFWGSSLTLRLRGRNAGQWVSRFLPMLFGPAPSERAEMNTTAESLRGVSDPAEWTPNPCMALTLYQALLWSALHLLLLYALWQAMRQAPLFYFASQETEAESGYVTWQVTEQSDYLVSEAKFITALLATFHQWKKLII